jgi:beta-barrel assembly-enhancing protease
MDGKPPDGPGRDCGDLVRRSDDVLRMFRWDALRNTSTRGFTLLLLGFLLMLGFLALVEPLMAEEKDVSASSAAGETITPVDSSSSAHKKSDRRADPVRYDVSKIGERGIGEGMNFYSLEKEMALGRQLASQVEMQARIITDPMVNDYINHLGQNIVRNSDAKVPFTIKVIDNDEVNAFALPGGFFFVNSGLIMAADNEAELAGVMAHEIAHVAARHGTKSMTRNQLINLASIPLVFVGGPLVFAMEQVAGVAVPMSFLKFSRDAELEADLLGMEYEYSAGYDPAAFVQFFEKLGLEKKHKYSLLAKAFSTHPMNSERIARAQGEIQQYLPPRAEYILDTSQFEEVKAHLSSVLNGRRLIGPSPDNSTNDNPQTTAQKSGDDERPTLKRQD